MAANYTLTGGTHSFAINPKAVNIAGTRQYNGTTNIVASDISGITGTVNTETLTMSSGLGSTSSANVGTYNLTDTSAGTLALGNGSNGGLASNYTLTGGTQDYTITQRVLNSSGSKTYDANTNALAGAITLSNLVSGEALNHSGTATISSANAGSYTISNLTGITIADGSGGTASNYTLTGGTHNFTVNPKVVSIQGNKTYDGNTTISSSDITSITGTVGSETLVMSSGTGTTSSQNAATYASAGINEGSLTLGNVSN